MMDPIEKFKTWWQRAVDGSPLKQKSAVCISTLDEHGYPNGRFVDLKRVDDGDFIFCSDRDSAKGREITAHAKVAMTAWWDHVGLQARVVGDASPIEPSLADELWQTRSHHARLSTISSQQSQPLISEQELAAELERNQATFADQEIARPGNWGGFRIRPRRLEFLTFRDDRLHIRELFERHGEGWNRRRLQP